MTLGALNTLGHLRRPGLGQRRGASTPPDPGVSELLDEAENQILDETGSAITDEAA